MINTIRRIVSVLCFTLAIMSFLAGGFILPLIIGLLGIISFPTNKASVKKLEDMIKQKKQITHHHHISQYLTVFSEAEDKRKKGYHYLAAKKYWQAIRSGESTQQWQEFGPPSAPYKGLARVYYHQQRDQQAVQILDRYISLAAEHNIGSKDIEKLKEKINHGGIKRLTNKYPS